jgi:GDP-L-fucose synthase
MPRHESLADKSIFIAGHRGLVGSALIRACQRDGLQNLILAARDELDLCDQQQVNDFFAARRPQVVIFAAGLVGGIFANQSRPAEFLYDNVAMAANAIHAAYQSGCERFLFLASTCIYPRLAPQPMPEECLLSGPLEPTNEPYALAKIVGLKLCQYYRAQHGRLFHTAMPTNLYGPGDNYELSRAHVVAALIRRIHEAKEAGQREIVVWGTGQPRRELLHVDDLADGLLHLLTLPDPPDWVNLGTGQDISILELTQLIARVIGFEGKIVLDPSKPDGTMVKRTDTNRMHALGWQAKIDLETGLRTTYQSFLQETEQGVLRVS